MNRASCASGLGLFLVTGGALGQDVTASRPSAWQFGYDEGFFLRSPDERHELVLEGLFQADYVGSTRPAARTSEFFIKRIRPELAGRFDSFLRFRLEPRFTEDESELEEAWVGAELGPDTLLMLGRMKAPFGLEEVRSRRHIDFPRFSILNQFSPAEDHGAFLNGRAWADVLEYGLAVYNGTGGADTDSKKDVAARLMGHPFVGQEGSALRNLQFGVAATWGDQDQDVSGDTITNEAGFDVIAYAPGARLAGERLRLGLELAWFHGPFMAQAEGLLLRQDMRQGTLERSIDFAGAYASIAMVLTGEAKSFRGVQPARPIGSGGAGAWVLAARVAELHCDRELEDAGIAESGTFTRRLRTVSVGLNWVLGPHALVRHAYVHNFYSQDVASAGHAFDHEGALMIEWQVHF